MGRGADYCYAWLFPSMTENYSEPPTPDGKRNIVFLTTNTMA